MAPISAIFSLALFTTAALALPWQYYPHGFPLYHDPEYPYSYPASIPSTPTAGFYPTATGTGTGVFPTAYPTAYPTASGYAWKRNLQERHGSPPFPHAPGPGFGLGTAFPAPTATGGYEHHSQFDNPHKQFGGPRGHHHQPYYPISHGPQSHPHPTSAMTAPTAPASTGFHGTAPASASTGFTGTVPAPTGY